MEINQISFKTALRQTGSVYIHNIGKIVVFALLVYLPIALIQLLFLDSAALEDFYAALVAIQEGSPEEAAALSAYSSKILAYFGGLTVISLFSLIYTAAITKVAACASTGGKITGTDIFDSAVRLFPKMLLTQLLSYLLVIVGFMMCFLPGIVFAIGFSQAVYLVALTGMWKMSALKLSLKLVRRHTILFVLLLLLNAAFHWVCDYIFGWISTGLVSITGLTGVAADAVIVVFYILQYIISALSLIFSVIVLLQVMKQNADLEIKLAEDIGKNYSF